MVEAILASDGDFSINIQKHIQRCDNCAALAESWNGLRNVKIETDEVPPSLDFTVRSAARKHQSCNKWMLPKWFYGISSVACAIMFAWLIVYSHQYESQRQYTTWDNSRNDQALFMLDSEIEFNQAFVNISPESNVDESDIDDIISEIHGDSNDDDFFDPLLTKNNEVELL